VTYIAKRAFRCRYGADTIEIAKGERLDDTHAVARAYPEQFDYRADDAPRADPRLKGAAARSAPAGRSRPRMTAAEQGRIRTARLRELEQRAADGWGRTASPDAQAQFWSGVARLIGTGPDQVEREGSALIDYVQSTQAEAVRSEAEELGAWLDR